MQERSWRDVQWLTSLTTLPEDPHHSSQLFQLQFQGIPHPHTDKKKKKAKNNNNSHKKIKKEEGDPRGEKNSGVN